MHMAFCSALSVLKEPPPLPSPATPGDVQWGARRYNPERLSDLSHHVNLQVMNGPYCCATAMVCPFSVICSL